jgi:hypothetical protein
MTVAIAEGMIADVVIVGLVMLVRNVKKNEIMIFKTGGNT